MKRTFFLLITVFFLLPATAQYRVDRLITAGRSALYYEDYVLSIQYFNHANFCQLAITVSNSSWAP